MSNTPIGAGGAQTVHAYQPAQVGGAADNPPQVGGRSSGEKFVKFFSDIGKAIQNAFKSIGGGAAAQPAHGAQAAPGTTTAVPIKNNLSSGDKKAMLAEFKQSDFRNNVPDGDLRLSDARKMTSADLDEMAKLILGRPDATKAIAQNGLTLSEAVAIHIYTSEAYKDINPALWGGKPMTDSIQTVVDEIKTGLGKLPSAKNGGETVQHGSRNLPDDVSINYQKNQTITEAACYSAADEIPHDFRGAHEFIVEAKEGSAGKNIEMFSRVPDEKEILFPPGTQFKVVSRQVADGGMNSMMPGHPKESTGLPTVSDFGHMGKCYVYMKEV